MNYRFVKHFKRNNNIICKQIATRWMFCNKLDTVLFFIKKRRQIRLNKIRIESARVRGSNKDRRYVFLAIS